MKSILSFTNDIIWTNTMAFFNEESCSKSGHEILRYWWNYNLVYNWVFLHILPRRNVFLPSRKCSYPVERYLYPPYGFFVSLVYPVCSYRSLSYRLPPIVWYRVCMFIAPIKICPNSALYCPWSNPYPRYECETS